MKDKFCSNLMNTECSKDYKKKHFWERRGLFKDNNDIEMVWQCTQCDLCVLENLEFMNKPKFKSDDTNVADSVPEGCMKIISEADNVICGKDGKYCMKCKESAGSVKDGEE